MRQVNTQKGFLLVAAVVIVAVAAFMAMVIMTLTAGSGQAGGIHVSSTQAFYAAEAGMERALYGFRQEGAACDTSGTSLQYTGTLTIGGGTASYSTSAMRYSPTATALSAAINATATVIPTSSANLQAAGYGSHGRITIGAESINYTGLSTDPAVCGAGNPSCFTGATRGASGTTAAAAAAGASVTQSQCLITSVGSAYGARRTVDRALSLGGTGAMVTYVHENNLGVPYYRSWTGAAWGTEATATSVGSEIRYMVLKSARTRNEMVLVTQSANGEIRAQIWNGTAWGNGTTAGATRLLGTVGNPGDRSYRAFDVEYETANDRAMVVYRNNNNSDPDYQVWTGTAWTAATTVTPAGLGGRPRWIELAPNPNSLSNDIALILINHNDDVDGLVWTAGAWNQLGNAGAFDTDAGDSATKIIDVVYEQTGAQRAMFVWGDDTNCRIHYRTWDGAALSAVATMTIPNTGATPCSAEPEWIRLAADPSSSAILLGVQDQDNDLNTCSWNGATWNCAFATHPEHVADTESGDNRTFDIAFSTDASTPGRAWLVWGALAGGGTNIWRREWTGAGWNPIDIFLGPDLCYPALLSHPNTGVLFAPFYEDADTGDISSVHYSGGAWSNPQQPLWNTGSTLDCQAGTDIHERVAVAAERSASEVFDWIEIFP